MKSKILLAGLLGFFFLPGCAYFNTYHNTKKLYKEALEEHKRRKDDKPSPTEIQKLDKTIEKASKILQVYPNSKYVDDSLFMLGECFFYKQEYLKALRKFDELLTLFPKSGLAPKAQLWKARTHLELDDYENAERVLLELQQRKKGKERDEAQYHLGEIYFRQEQYAQAAELFEQAARRVEDKRMRADSYMRLGECRYELTQFGAAAKAYEQAIGKSNELDFKFKANLACARSLKADGEYDRATRRLNKMLSEFATHPEISWAKFEIADCLFLRGKVDEAAAQFTFINTNYKRTEASAAAFYALGEIYQSRHHNYPKAKEHFEKVSTENARSDRVAPAQQHAKAIDEFLKLQDNIKLLELQRASAQGQTADSLALAAQLAEKQTKGRRASIRRLPTRKQNLSNDPKKLENDLANSLVNLANLYENQLGLPDSAREQYFNVVRNFPNTDAAPRALYALAYLVIEQDSTSTALQDSLLHVLAVQYSQTPHGRDARKKLGMPVLNTQNSNGAADKFLQAEKLWLTDHQPEDAIRLYQEFLQDQPESELSPKTLYAIGWIYETELDNNDRAFETYQQLIEKYPNSAYSNKVRKKVTTYTQQQNGNAAASSPAPIAVAASDSATMPPMPAVAHPDTANAPEHLPENEKLRRRIAADRELEREIPPSPEQQPNQAGEEAVEEEVSDDEPPAEEPPPFESFLGNSSRSVLRDWEGNFFRCPQFAELSFSTVLDG